MIETAAILRLMSWLSPVFPTGGFAYSAGLEQAVAEGIVKDERGLCLWVKNLLEHGTMRNDAILFSAAHRDCTDGHAIAELAELAIALAGSAERLRESADQGTSFLDAARSWPDNGERLPDSGTPLPVAAGAACGLSDIPVAAALPAYLHAFVQNQLQCAIRLSVTGQRGAARLLAELEPAVAQAALRAESSTPGDLGSCAIVAEMAAMNHEKLQPRLFLS